MRLACLLGMDDARVVAWLSTTRDRPSIDRCCRPAQQARTIPGWLAVHCLRADAIDLIGLLHPIFCFFCMRFTRDPIDARGGAARSAESHRSLKEINNDSTDCLPLT